MFRKFCLTGIYVLILFPAAAQHPLQHWTEAVQTRYSSRQPVISYLLRVDKNDLSVFSIRMQIRNIPDTFRVAMVTHPEYDDRYWRFIEQLEVETAAGRGAVQRKDISVWQVVTHGGEAVLHYQLRLPPVQREQRAAWRPFLSPNGGLAGGLHCFLYVVGATLAPSHVAFRLPEGWNIATALEPTPDPSTFFAPSVAVLADCPVLIGAFASSLFTVDGVPHRVAYHTQGNVKKIDTGKLVNAVQKLVKETLVLFGRLPYKAYTFLFFDDAYGALEHANSVTIGVPASMLREGFSEVLTETAHEYFHAWNLVRIRPAERIDAGYQTPPLSKGLWFSEGLTMYYADLLLRRAGFPLSDSSRTAHLTGLLNRYFVSDVYAKLSAEKISLADNGPVGMLGDYVASPHLQGELLGIVLDLVVRQATLDSKSMDDVMRKMLEDFSGEKGFTNKGIEQAVQNVCRCDVRPFFRDHIFGAGQLDFNRYLQLIGLRYSVQYRQATNPGGKPAADLRIYAWKRPGEDTVRVGISNPASCWAKAGLHTGDVLLAINDQPVNSDANWEMVFRRSIRSAKISDQVTVSVLRSGRRVRLPVLVTGYLQPDVRVSKLNGLTPKQQERFDRWNAGR